MWHVFLMLMLMMLFLVLLPGGIYLWYCLVTCGGVFSKEVHIFSDFCSSIIMAAFQDQAMKHASLGVVQPF